MGNPGVAYERTRHNVGFRCVRRLAQRRGATAWRSKFHGRFLALQPLGVLLLLPETFMNDSGESIAACAAFYRLQPASVLVICDDINLPFGRLRLRRSGSAGGHNGLKSVVAALHTTEFPRLRIGVGRTGMDTIGHVLAPFNAAEESVLGDVIERAVDGTEIFLQQGADAAVAAVNANGGDVIWDDADIP
ncbi:MAG: aminoacyl-tRNA hydrolase [Candidatus Eremiobacter antarcticus]